MLSELFLSIYLQLGGTAQLPPTPCEWKAVNGALRRHLPVTATRKTTLDLLQEASEYLTVPPALESDKTISTGISTLKQQLLIKAPLIEKDPLEVRLILSACGHLASCLNEKTFAATPTFLKSSLFEALGLVNGIGSFASGDKDWGRKKTKPSTQPHASFRKVRRDDREPVVPIAPPPWSSLLMKRRTLRCAKTKDSGSSITQNGQQENSSPLLRERAAPL